MHEPTIRLAPYLCPDLLILVACCAGVGLLRTAQAVKQSRHAPGSTRAGWLRLCWLNASASPESVFCWILLTLVVIATTRTLFSVRYLTMAVPLLYVLIARTLYGGGPRPSRGIAAATLLALVGVNLVNRNGALFPSLASGPVIATTGFDKNYERSHEYLPLHRANVQVAKLLSTRYADRIIITTPPFAHILGLPRLGYVERPLHGYCESLGTSIPTFHNLAKIQDATLSRPIFVGDRFVARYFLPPCEAGDVVIFDDRLNPALIAFEKKWLDRPSNSAQVADWCRERGWPGVTPSQRVVTRGQFLAACGRVSQAVDEFHLALEQHPDDTNLRLQLAVLLKRQGQLTFAAVEAEEVLRVEPNNALALVTLASIRFQQGEPLKLLSPLQDFLKRNPGSVTARRLLAGAHLASGNLQAAKVSLKALLELEPTDGDALFQLGYVYLNEHNQQLAIASFSQALRYRLRPDYAARARQYLTTLPAGS